MLQIYLIHVIYLTFNPDKYKFCFLTSSPIFPSVAETVTLKGSPGLICRVHLQSVSSWSYLRFSRPAAMVTDIKLLLCSWQTDSFLARPHGSDCLPRPCPFWRHDCFLEQLSSRFVLGQLSPSHIQAGLTSFFLRFYFIFKLYIIVLVLPNIKMNPPQAYMWIDFWEATWL